VRRWARPGAIQPPSGPPKTLYGIYRPMWRPPAARRSPRCRCERSIHCHVITIQHGAHCGGRGGRRACWRLRHLNWCVGVAAARLHLTLVTYMTAGDGACAVSLHNPLHTTFAQLVASQHTTAPLVPHLLHIHRATRMQTSSDNSVALCGQQDQHLQCIFSSMITIVERCISRLSTEVEAARL